MISPISFVNITQIDSIPCLFALVYEYITINPILYSKNLLLPSLVIFLLSLPAMPFFEYVYYFERYSVSPSNNVGTQTV